MLAIFFNYYRILCLYREIRFSPKFRGGKECSSVWKVGGRSDSALCTDSTPYPSLSPVRHGRKEQVRRDCNPSPALSRLFGEKPKFCDKAIDGWLE